MISSRVAENHDSLAHTLSHFEAIGRSLADTTKSPFTRSTSAAELRSPRSRPGDQDCSSDAIWPEEQLTQYI